MNEQNMHDASRGKVRILVIEDHHIINRAMKELLESINCDVDIAENGEKALEFYKQNYYELVFIDLGLPDIDGHEVAKRIRDIEQGKRNTPLIGLSAQNNHIAITQAIDSGMNEFMIKPLTQEYCINKLIEYCNYYPTNY